MELLLLGMLLVSCCWKFVGVELWWGFYCCSGVVCGKLWGCCESKVVGYLLVVVVKVIRSGCRTVVVLICSLLL